MHVVTRSTALVTTATVKHDKKRACLRRMQYLW
jgi:hypothetical protein